MSTTLLPSFVMHRRAQLQGPQGRHGWHLWALVAALGLFVLGGPALCYLWLGAPHEAASGVKPNPKPAAEVPTSTPTRSKANAFGPGSMPRQGDADGWLALGRAQASADRHGLAVESFKAAERLRPDDANLLADHAFSTAVLDPQRLMGESSRLVERALQLDAKNAKALALAGSLAVDGKDYAAAVRYWEQLARAEPGGQRTGPAGPAQHRASPAPGQRSRRLRAGGGRGHVGRRAAHDALIQHGVR